jgi:hypothetical protein
LLCEWKKPITAEHCTSTVDLHQLCRRQQEWLKILQAQLATKDQQLEALNQLHADRSQQIIILQKELTQRSHQIIAMQQEISQRDALIASLYSAHTELKDKPAEVRRKTSSSGQSGSQRSPKTLKAVNSPPDGRSSPYESVWTTDSFEELNNGQAQWINVSFPVPTKSAKK